MTCGTSRVKRRFNKAMVSVMSTNRGVDEIDKVILSLATEEGWNWSLQIVAQNY